MLRIHNVKVSRIISPVIVTDFEWIPMGLDIGVPSDSLKNCIYAVVFASSIDSLESVFHKKIPNVRILFMPIPPLVL